MPTIERYENKGGKFYRVRFRTPDRKQTMKRGFKTKRDAEQWLADMTVSKARGEFIGASAARITVGEWAERWYEAQIHLKATTRSNYRHSLDKRVLPQWGHRQIGSISFGEVQAWVSLLSQTLAPSSVRVPYLTLSGVMKYAVQDGRLAKNPCDGVKLPRIVKSKHGYLTHDQVGDLAQECGVYADVILFLAYTGLRWGEMAAIRVDRLDMLRRRIDVTEAVTDVRGQMVWGTPKNHESRSVPFPAFLSEPLAKRCEGKSRSDLVFTAPDGGVLRGGNFRKRIFKGAIERMMEVDDAFPSITPHDLRHTAASLAISAGANVKAVQRMLGHADASMTLNTYADLFPDDLDAVAVALDVAHSATTGTR